MKSRILSLAVIAGMLAATGCSGGGAGVTGVNAPVAPPTGGTPAKGTSSISASFQIPVSAAQAAAMSSGRQAKYLSPGTNGISVLLGDGSLVTGSAGLSGTAQLSGSVNETGAAAQPANISFLSASNSTTPVVGQTLTVQHLNSSGNTATGTTSAVFTITAVLASTIVSGTFAASAGAAANGAGGAPAQPAGYNFLAGDLITFTATGPSSTGQQFIIGNQNTAAGLTPTPVVNAPIPSTIFGTTANSAYSYSFKPSAVAGYYVFNLNITGLLGSKAFVLGVVTNDLGHGNYVLSEAQQAISSPANGTALAAFTLQPIVASVFEPAPTLVTPLQLGNPGANPIAGFGTYESTIFATDELGYAVPSINGAVVPGNAPAGAMITVVPTTSGTALAYNKYAAPGTLASGSLTTPPTGGGIAPSAVLNTLTIGTGGDYVNVFGTYFFTVASSPSNVTPGGGSNIAGNPVNIVCGVATAGVASKATITSVVPNGATAVAGYTFTPGTNYPAASTVVTLPAVDCTPGIGAVIN